MPKRIALCLLTLAVMASTGSSAPKWPQFRGVNASGVNASAKPPVEIGPAEPVIWKVPVPWSPSSPIIWDDRIFLTTFNEGELETRCHDRADGRLLWRRGFKPEGIEEFHRSDGSPAASTPATDGERVVSYFGSFGVICYDFAGKELWRYPLSVAQSGGRYGTGTSPIIVGNQVVLNRDQHRFSSLLALDLNTGKRLWETPRPESSGSFGTPVHWANNGTDEIVVAAYGLLKGYSLKTGEERWRVTGVTGFVCTTPVLGNGLLYFAAFSNAQPDAPLPSWDEFLKNMDKNGDDIVAFEEVDLAQRDYYRGLDTDRDGKFTKNDWDEREKKVADLENLMVAVRPGGTGDITDTHVEWEYRKGLPYVPSPLFYDGIIYMVKDGGVITSIDAESGSTEYDRERIRRAPGAYYASPIAADGRIYVASVSGILTVLEAGGSKPKILHQADFGARILASPAIVGEALYLRTEKHLFAFGR